MSPGGSAPQSKRWKAGGPVNDESPMGAEGVYHRANEKVKELLENLVKDYEKKMGAPAAG
jgi:hypothetical protein